MEKKRTSDCSSCSRGHDDDKDDDDDGDDDDVNI